MSKPKASRFNLCHFFFFGLFNGIMLAEMLVVVQSLDKRRVGVK